MGQQPQTRRSLRDRERRQHAVTILAVVAAVAVLGTAAWVGTALSTSSSPTAASRQTTEVVALGSASASVAPSTSARSSVAVSGSAPGTASADGATQTRAAPAASSAASGAATSSPGATASATATATATASASVDPAGQALASCRTAWGLQSVARSAADRSLSQWQRHLQIMNDLQAGRISVATAKAQWPSTTDRAQENVAAFRAADQALGASTATCASSPSAKAAMTAATNAALTRCATAMGSVDAVLARARTAIAPWEEHLTDQSHFKAGGMTASMAEAAWRVMWRKGLATLPAYLDAAQESRGATCTLPASP